jgi:hypothetical protein
MKTLLTAAPLSALGQRSLIEAAEAAGRLALLAITLAPRELVAPLRRHSWEPDGERGIHFTSVQNLHDATGTFIGTVTVDGYPMAGEDGRSFYDAKRVRLTFRDPAGAVTMVLGEDGSLPPIFGNRMRLGALGFPEGTPGAATPRS